MSLDFLIVTLIIVASPGTGVIYTLAAGLSRGGRASVLAAFACTLGIVPHLAAAMMGLAAVLHTSALAYGALKYAGVAYLLYMAVQSLREHGALEVKRTADSRSALRVVVDGILINILNPKLSIFFVAFLPQFIAVDETSPFVRMLELSSVFMTVTFVVFAIYGLFAAAMRDKVIRRPAVMKWTRRSFAGAFAALGAKLAFSER
jgi:threonine/homoserine/homoserine lactone efflux protein